MHYRRFGQLDYTPSALGFGAMRLPVVDGAHDRIDREPARELLTRAVEGGVNYVDTAYNYHGGTSEEWVGWALRGGLRERVKIATKLPIWKVERADDFDRYLDEQLERLGTGIDFYLLHSLDEDTWRDNVLAHDVLGAAERALSDGRIGHFGFSFHDRCEAFQPILDGSDLWEFCQIQYNFMDEEYQAGPPRPRVGRCPRLGRRRHGAAARRPARTADAGRRGGVGRRRRGASLRRAAAARVPGRVGPALALGPARGLARAQRHEYARAGRAERALRRTR